MMCSNLDVGLIVSMGSSLILDYRGLYFGLFEGARSKGRKERAAPVGLGLSVLLIERTGSINFFKGDCTLCGF